MLIRHWSRLCSSCSRVVRSGGWRALTGVKHASWLEMKQPGTGAPTRPYHSDLCRNESVQRYLQQLVEECREVSKKLQHAFLNEADRKLLMRRHTELLPVAEVFQSVEGAQKELEEVLSLLHSESLTGLNHSNITGLCF